jgi:enolase-phosphatase E1
VQAVLLDIEGTTSSVAYVYDELFPYVRRHLEAFLKENWEAAAVADARDQIARDAGASNFAAWSQQASPAAAREKLLAHLRTLMAADSKATGLKNLQGQISRAGYTSGELKAHVYPDVLPALQRWKASGRSLYIFSSGSIAAQQQFFEHSVAGNLRPFFSGHFDTTTGPKRELESYRKIAESIGLPPQNILFISDVPAELDAARAAGYQTALSLRPGNAPVPSGHGHSAIHSFEEIA